MPTMSYIMLLEKSVEKNKSALYGKKKDIKILGENILGKILMFYKLIYKQ